jgi:hypothetical protein
MFSKRLLFSARIKACADMISRSCLLIVAALSFTLLAGPAFAVTFIDITPGNTNTGGVAYTLIDGGNYSFNSPTIPGPANIDAIFKFFYQPPPTLGAISAVANNAQNTVQGFTLTWLFNSVDSFGTASVVQGPIAQPAGALNNIALSLADGTGFYYLELKGTVPGGAGGQYNLSVTSATPLPGTLPLIAGGLGALWMVGRKRKARKSPAVA